MLLLAADENFNYDIVRGVRRRNAAIDIVRIQDVGLSAADDPRILEWAAQAGRILLTHDVATMTRYAYERVHPASRCRESLKSADMCQLALRSKKLNSWRNAAWTANGKGKCVICRCAEDIEARH